MKKTFILAKFEHSSVKSAGHVFAIQIKKPEEIPVFGDHLGKFSVREPVFQLMGLQLSDGPWGNEEKSYSEFVEYMTKS